MIECRERRGGCGDETEKVHSPEIVLEEGETEQASGQHSTIEDLAH